MTDFADWGTPLLAGHMKSAKGHPPLTFAFHDSATIPPGMVRKILTKDIGLSEEEAMDLL